MHNIYVLLESPIMTTDDIGPTTGCISSLTTGKMMCVTGPATLSVQGARR